MCRMLGIVSRENLIPYNWLEYFRILGLKGNVPPGTKPGHLDGWGMAGYISNGPQFLGRSFLGVNTDRVVYQESAKKASEEGINILICHLRKASRGEKTIYNTHPFVHNGWIFCHNGTIYNHGELPLVSECPSGNTDRERFFFLILEEIGNKRQFSRKLSGIKNAIQYVWNNHEYTSLTFLLSDGETLWAYRDFNEKYKRGDYTIEELEEYHTLNYARQKTGFIVCSETLHIPRLEWKSMVNGELVAVNQKGRMLMNEFL